MHAHGGECWRSRHAQTRTVPSAAPDSSSEQPAAAVQAANVRLRAKAGERRRGESST
jgi:hypothetical protein